MELLRISTELNELQYEESAMKSKQFNRIKRTKESGQVMFFTALGLGIFLIGAMAFAIDLSNMWFNRQSAQTAADAACTAAAMDMLVGDTDGTLPSGANFTPSSKNTYDCSSASPLPAPCSYAALNGYSSTISQSNANSGKLGNNVFIDFPPGSTVPGLSGSLPPTSVAAAPLVRVKVTNNISTWFAGMLKGMTKQSTGATAICGVLEATSPIPILVLNPTISGALSMNGGGATSKTGDIAIAGGPSKSIQVNSSSTSAVSLSGTPSIDLCAGGGTYCGSSMGVWGSESAPGGFWNTTTKCSSVNTLCSATQTAPQWNSPSAPIADPLASVSAPADMGFNGTMTPTASANPSIGCFDSSGCDEYGPGDYTGVNGISVKHRTAIFDPGIYYIKNGFSVDSNSCVLPSFATGDGSGGVIFYFADNSSLAVDSNSGAKCPTTAYNGVTGSFNTTAGPAGSPLANGVKCTGTSVIPKNIPSVLTGSVLLAPCQAPTVKALCGTNCNINPGVSGGGGFGDPLGGSDTFGEQRGILFFQDRATPLSKKNQPSWGGNGSMLLAGTMYFHECVTSGADTGQGCDTTNAYTDFLSLGGTPSSSTYVLGDVIVDELSLSGNAGLTMDLNPSATLSTLKAALVQ